MSRRQAKAAVAAPLIGAGLLTLAAIVPSALNPRTLFEEEAIEQLAQSIQQEGLLSPLVVRPKKDTEGTYELVAGERRWRACKLLGLDEVRVIVRDDLDDDVKALTAAIVENVQREDLEVLDLARAYKKLRELGHPLKEVARLAKRSHPDISNTIRLLELPEGVQEQITRRELTPSHGKALLSLIEWPGDIEHLAAEVPEKGLSSHALEKLVAGIKLQREAERSPGMPLDEESTEEMEGAPAEPEVAKAPEAPTPIPTPAPAPQKTTTTAPAATPTPRATAPAPVVSTPAPAPAPVETPPAPSALSGFVNLMIRQEDHEWMIENRVKPKQVFADARRLRELVDEDVERLAQLLADHLSQKTGKEVTLRDAIAATLHRRALELGLSGLVATDASETDTTKEENNGE